MKFVVYKYNCPRDWREICRVDSGNMTCNCEGFEASAVGAEQKIASRIHGYKLYWLGQQNKQRATTPDRLSDKKLN